MIAQVSENALCHVYMLAYVWSDWSYRETKYVKRLALQRVKWSMSGKR